MLRALLLAAALFPALASAQVTINETSDAENGSDQIINIRECQGLDASRFGITWKLPSAAGTVTSTDLRISDTSGCPITSSSNSAKTTSLSNQAGTSGSLTQQSAQNLVTLVGYSCTGNESRPLYVCAVGQLGGVDVASAVQSATITLDTITPGKPVNVTVGAGDSSLRVSWDAVSSAQRYRVVATPSDGSPPKQTAQLTNTTSHVLQDLQNDLLYQVTVIAYSAGGNPSTASDPVPGTPVQVNDFWRLYHSYDGRDQGGCGTPGAGTLSLLALAALALRRRRRRALPLVAVAGLLTATPAHAQTESSAAAITPKESPRWGSFEFRLVPYRPNVDAEFRGSGNAPYQEAFGSGKHLMFRADLAYTVYRGFDGGSVDVGGAIGYWQAYGHGRIAAGPDTGAVSSDPTRLRIIPTSLTVTYRADQLVNRGWFPLAPYVRFALERYNWWVTAGSSGVAYAQTPSGNLRGAGATNGYSFTGGLAFQLDYWDHTIAREMDNESGINHAYLFGEVTRLKVNDFGSSKSWDLSTDGSVVFAGGVLLVF